MTKLAFLLPVFPTFAQSVFPHSRSSGSTWFSSFKGYTKVTSPARSTARIPSSAKKICSLSDDHHSLTSESTAPDSLAPSNSVLQTHDLLSSAQISNQSSNPVHSKTIESRSNRSNNWLSSAALSAALVATIISMSSRSWAAAATATASSVSSSSAAAAASPLANFTSGLTASFVLIFASEIGDKTFFISALLSMKNPKFLIALGSMLALGIMTVISVAIGQIFHAVPNAIKTSIPIDDYAAVALLLWFGFTNIRDALQSGDDNQQDGELKDAEELIEEAEEKQRLQASERTLPWWKSSAFGIVAETFSLVFLAEWGDKSMLATVALAAAKSPWGVVVGGITGHLIATILAIFTGSYLGKYISEKTAKIIGGVLFFVFAGLTLFGLY